jgi:adenylate cyclase
MTGTYKVPTEPAETTRATVLFADMRGYTAIAERLPPAQVVPLLDEFFRILGSATQAHGGEIFYMAGDGMMAGFGVREADRHRAREALAAGRAMLEGFASVAARWQRDMSIVAGVGVGLHLGEVALGFLGPPGKKFMTMVGDTANVAARLCGRARTGELLLSSVVAAALHDDVRIADPTGVSIPFLQLPQFALRGRGALLDIWCVPARERRTL